LDGKNVIIGADGENMIVLLSVLTGDQEGEKNDRKEKAWIDKEVENYSVM
jgi:hypothetical protein